MTRRTSKREKGITLIALVITIIIMLILAGVIISSVTSNKGILSRAKDSRKVYDESKAEEQVRLLMNEYAMASAEAGAKGEKLKLEDYLKEKKADGTITDYKVNEDGSAEITIGDKTVKVNKDLSVADNTNKDLSVADNTNKGGESSSTTGGITYTDSDNKTQTLTKGTPAGTEIGTTANIDGQTLNWYLFDVSDDGKTAYLVSTPTYWVPDPTKPAVSGAWAPKLVSANNRDTYAMRQAIQKLSNGTNSYSSGSVTYKPSDNTLNYYKSVNSQWSAKRGSTAFANMNENEQAACYLADADIFAGIKDQVNNADGNLKGKIQTLVGGASAEQWCKAYNKQSVASSSKITCEYRYSKEYADSPGYIYKVNGTLQHKGWYTDYRTIVGNDIYGAAYTNENTSSSNPFYNISWWWLASPSSYDSNSVCYVYGSGSVLSHLSSIDCNSRVSLFASVAL